jgi:hypothetical protein
MDVDSLLRTAIAEKRLIVFTLDGCRRIAEPHDYGIVGGEARLFFYQTGGESRSGRPFGWRWAVLSRVEELHLLDKQFAGSRPAPSGRHIQWDSVIASVSVREPGASTPAEPGEPVKPKPPTRPRSRRARGSSR